MPLRRSQVIEESMRWLQRGHMRSRDRARRTDACSLLSGKTDEGRFPAFE